MESMMAMIETEPADSQEVQIPQEPSIRRQRRAVVTIILILLVLYPLSLGPVMYLFIRVPTIQRATPVIETIYLPLFYFSDSHLVFAESYNDYLSWWINKGVKHELSRI